MPKRYLALCLSSIVWGGSFIASAQDTMIIAVPFSKAYSPDGTPMIVNGQKADPAEYPASYKGGVAGKQCTWFLVGAGTLVGAAHCVVGTDAAIPLAKVTLKHPKSDHVAECTVPSGYWDDLSLDWALCKLTPPIEKPGLDGNGVSGFEVINLSSKRLEVRPKVEISGFGCSQDGGAMEKEYFIGTARVVDLPPDARVLGSLKRTPNSIKIRQAPSLLCSGDSGGPAFLYQTGGRAYRVVIGTNSSTAVDAGVSFISSLSTPAAKAFMTKWSSDNSEKICGFHKDAADCRPFLQ
jgi:hypothetical protein